MARPVPPQPQTESERASEPLTEPQRLERAEAAFGAGDFHALRRELHALQNAAAAEVRARAEHLTRAVSEDPAFVAVIALCLLGLFAVFARYILE